MQSEGISYCGGLWMVFYWYPLAIWLLFLPRTPHSIHSTILHSFEPNELILPYLLVLPSHPSRVWFSPPSHRQVLSGIVSLFSILQRGRRIGEVLHPSSIRGECDLWRGGRHDWDITASAHQMKFVIVWIAPMKAAKWRKDHHYPATTSSAQKVLPLTNDMAHQKATRSIFLRPVLHVAADLIVAP